MRETVTIAIVVIAIELATTCGAFARGSKPHAAPELYQQLLAARVACDKADETLFSNMQKAAQLFADFTKVRGFPLTEANIELVRHELYSIANENPYAKDPLLAKEIEGHFPDATTQVEIRLLPGLSVPEIGMLEKNCPESWQSAPGSITIMHNANDLIVVWAAGADGHPLRDKENSVRFAAIRLVR